jgi:hypothetical protein
MKTASHNDSGDADPCSEIRRKLIAPFGMVIAIVSESRRHPFGVAAAATAQR